MGSGKGSVMFGSFAVEPPNVTGDAKRASAGDVSLLTAALHACPLAVVAIDGDKKIRIWNRAAESMFGWSESEVLALADPTTRLGTGWGLMFEDLIANDDLVAVEREIDSSDGRPIRVSLSSTALRGPMGDITGGIAILEDLTQRDRWMREARASEERLAKVLIEHGRLQEAVQSMAREWRETFDAIDYPALLLDLSGHVLRANRTAKEVSNRGYWQIKGETLASVGNGQPWKRAAEIAHAVARSRSNASCLVRDPSTAKTWDITAGLVSGIGRDDRIIMIARDVTATVDLQESLRKSETMSAMGALVAGVAHEVRNPLFSISATLDAFEAKFGENPDHRPYLTVLRGEIDRLNQLMQDLLQYGRPAVLETARGSVRDAVDQAVGSCTTLGNRSGVAVVRSFADALPPLIMDRRRIIQVFHNLIANAIQHSKPGQTVSVEAATVIQDEELWIECAVLDSGPGFAHGDIPRVFEPFFTRRSGGTGLGLSIVQRIIEEHGGRVTAANRPEGGAVITVRFKAAEA